MNSTEERAAYLAEALGAVAGHPLERLLGPGDESMMPVLEEFLDLAMQAAGRRFDPVRERAAFVQALSEQLEAGFGLGPDSYDGTAPPELWCDHPDDPDVVVWDPGAAGERD